MTIAEINSLSHEAFVDALGWVFEHSPWVAERAWWRRPFKSLEALHRAMMDEVDRATIEERLALLRAHPELGTRKEMSPASVNEQAAAGLDRETSDSELHQLNQQYREKFGRPFIFAVNGATRNDIVAALRQRLSASSEEEFVESLRQVGRIAWRRIMG